MQYMNAKISTEIQLTNETNNGKVPLSSMLYITSRVPLIIMSKTHNTGVALAKNSDFSRIYIFYKSGSLN